MHKSNEDHIKWVWRYTAQHIPFSVFKADYLKSMRPTRQSIKHDAHVAAYHRHRAYGHLPQRESMSLADALKLISAKHGRAQS